MVTEKGTFVVDTHTLVLAELLHISQKKKILPGMKEVLKKINEGGGFVIVPFDLPVFEELIRLLQDFELHDGIIVATAKLYGAKVLTKDEKITKCGVIEVIW